MSDQAAKSIVVAICGLLLFVACEQRPDVAPVSGVVTFEGEPVVDAEVTFHPANGRPASGKTDSQGEFTLTTFDGKPGALLGQHRVTIVKHEPVPGQASGPYQQFHNVLPPIFASSRDSPLTANIEPKSDNRCQFELRQ